MAITTAVSKEELQVVIFKLGNEEYCVPVSQVREIQNYIPPTRIPDTPVFVEGVINLRGQIIPVIDLKKRFNIGIIEKTPDTCFIVVDMKDETLGILVDSVSEVVTLSKEIFEPPPAKVVSSINTSYISGVGKLPNRLLIALDLEKILSSDEIEELKQ